MSSTGSIKGNKSKLQQYILQCKTEILQCKTEILQSKTEILQCKKEILQCKTEILQCKTEILQCKTEILQNGTVHQINYPFLLIFQWNVQKMKTGQNIRAWAVNSNKPSCLQHNFDRALLVCHSLMSTKSITLVIIKKNNKKAEREFANSKHQTLTYSISSFILKFECDSILILI